MEEDRSFTDPALEELLAALEGLKRSDEKMRKRLREQAPDREKSEATLE